MTSKSDHVALSMISDYFMMFVVFLLSLVLVSSLPLVSSEAVSASALLPDPHAVLSDQAGNQAESPATNIPKIESVGGKRTYPAGETAQLHCLVKDLDPYVILWRKGLTQVLYAGTYKISLDPRIKLSASILEISDLYLNDTGEYVCQISTNPPTEIVYQVKIIPGTPNIRNSDPTSSSPGHPKHPAKNNSHHTPPSTSCSYAAIFALLNIFISYYILHQV